MPLFYSYKPHASLHAETLENTKSSNALTSIGLQSKPLEISTGDSADANQELFGKDASGNRAATLHKAAATPDPEERFALFQDMEAILIEEAPMLPVYFYTNAYLLNPSVKGWNPTILDNHPYKYVYLEAE